MFNLDFVLETSIKIFEDSNRKWFLMHKLIHHVMKKWMPALIIKFEFKRPNQFLYRRVGTVLGTVP